MKSISLEEEVGKWSHVRLCLWTVYQVRRGRRDKEMEAKGNTIMSVWSPEKKKKFVSVILTDLLPMKHGPIFSINCHSGFIFRCKLYKAIAIVMDQGICNIP